MKFIQFIHSRYLALSLFLFMNTFGRLAIAQTDNSKNPFDPKDIVHKDVQDKDIFSQTSFYLGWGMRLVIIAIVAIGAGYAIYAVVSKFNEARQRGEWNEFIMTLIFAIILFIVMSLFASYGWGWSNSILDMSK